MVIKKVIIIKNNDKLLFIGDSITDANRSRPIGKSVQTDSGMGGSTGLGSGYVSIINNLLIASHPQLNLTLLNLGCNGNRIRDLKHRWQRDVIDLKPDWLIILIGTNDVWRQFDRPLDRNQVLENEFELTYREIIQQSNVIPNQLVLMSPYYLETSVNDLMLKKLKIYTNIVKKIATEYQTNFVDLQKSFDKFLTYRTSTSISADKIHLNKAGHTIIAQSFLNAIESHFPAMSNLSD